MTRHLISISDVEDDVESLFTKTQELKEAAKTGVFENLLENKTLAMIFEKASTRTRVSFEVALAQMGGHAIHLDESQIQLYRGESLKDTALTLSRYVDCIMIRARKHEDVTELAKYSTVPVINGLTDLAHPCQALSDLYTIKEKVGFENVKLAYVGDGNNVCNSLALGSSIVGLDVTVGSPEGYGPDASILEAAKKKASKNKSIVQVTNDPKEAVKDANVVYTDVWISMGQEENEKTRLEAFKDFQVNATLLEEANSPLIMHCLPAHRGREITDDVLDSSDSIVFDQAENRLHMQKALLHFLIKGK